MQINIVTTIIKHKKDKLNKKVSLIKKKKTVGQRQSLVSVLVVYVLIKHIPAKIQYTRHLRKKNQNCYVNFFMPKMNELPISIEFYESLFLLFFARFH